MPRKTKKQKRLADLHRKIVATEGKNLTLSEKEVFTSSTKEEKMYVKKPSYSKPKYSYEQTPLDAIIRKETTKDIIKTCIVIGILLCLQIGFFFLRDKIPFFSSYL